MYNCECCKYVTKKRFNYDKHLLSNKHKLIAGITPNVTPTMIATKVAKPSIVCNYCKQTSKLAQHAQCKQIYDLNELVQIMNTQLEKQQTQINEQKLQIDHIISEIF
jgi:hypothetical protein